MTGERERRALELFERLLDIDASQRAAWLDEHCDDADVRARVEALLRADASEAGLLDEDADRHLAHLAVVDPPTPPMPDEIGQYRIVERIGEGGMATVYRAERADGDFDQTVALKLILPTRQTEHWQARFLQERQILASLQHSNIAVLIDGGITGQGQPYFAMEYVDGEPITAYCDSNRLGVRARLKLFLAICDAVSYAHSNLIVHRDLKPSNILVAENGQPKLLDFGIAKILSVEDMDRTRTTLRALTPDYAAPEQFVGGPVTTAVDVYALGALLFELLSGHRPFARVSGSALDIEREIRRRGAPTFAQLATDVVAADREGVAAARRTTWRRLQRTIRGDLEKISLKALRKEPERRYVSVEALAADLRRYLDGLPVEARADTAWYRIGKFASRHPVGLPLGLVAVAGLMVTSGLALYQARQAETAAAIARIEAAKANETRDFVTSLFEFAGPDKSLGDQLTARQLLDLGATRVDQELAGQPELHAEMSLLLANTYGQLGLYDTAMPLAIQAAELYRSVGSEAQHYDALLSRARLHRQKGDFTEAQAQLDVAATLLATPPAAARSAFLIERGELRREQAQFDIARSDFEAAVALDRERLAPADDIARDLYRLGTLEFSAGDNNLGLDLLRQAATLLVDGGLDNTTQYASIRHDIGVMLIQRGELDNAKSVLEGVRDIRLNLLGEQHPDLAATFKELAGIARQQGESDEAERLYLAALAINESMLGSEHPETANNLNSLAVFYRGLGNDERALSFAQRALEGARKAYGEAHPTVGLMFSNIGSMQRMLGQLDDARASTSRGFEILVGALGENHHLAGVAANALAGVQHEQGEMEAAEANYRKALAVFQSTAGQRHPHTVAILNGLASLLFDTARLDEAQAAWQQAVDIGKEALPPGHPNLAIVQLGVARIDAVQGRCEDALQLDAEYRPVVTAAGQDSRPSVREALEAIDVCR